MTKFKLGDKVTVVNSGLLYTTYTQWAEKHGLSNYVYNALLTSNEQGVVVAIGVHDVNPDMKIVAFRVDDKDYIIGEGGIEKVDERTPAQKAGLVIGNKYFVSESAEGTGAKGKVVTFYRDDRSENPAFEDADGEVYYPLIKYVTPCVEKVKTPAEQAGLAVGKQYFVARSVVADLENQVVTFKVDDSTNRPKFEMEDGTYCWPYIHEVTEYVVTTIVFDKILTQAQIDAIKTLVA